MMIKDHLDIIDSNTSAGNFINCFFIFLLHFFTFFGFLMTSNFPAFISFSSLCLLLCFPLSLFSFRFWIFFSLNYFNCCRISIVSFCLYFFSSHVMVLPLFLQFLLGLRFTPTFHCLPLLLDPKTYLSSLFLISSGSGKC